MTRPFKNLRFKAFIFFSSHPGLSNSGVALVISHPGEVDVVDAFKNVDVVIYQNLGKPKNRVDSGEILTATLFESFLSYQTHEGRLAL